MTDRTSKPCRSAKFLRNLKLHFNKNSESCDNGRVYPTFQGLPVPAPPPATFAATNVHASFPTPTPPWSQTWCTPGQHDQEASGSNHTSKQNSEYFDALDTSEYLYQHQIPNYSAELLVRQGNHQPGLEQLACSFQDIRVSTSPTSQDQTYNYPNPYADQPFDYSETNLASASYYDPVNEQYSNELYSNEHLLMNFDDATATSAQQPYEYGTMDQSCYLDFDDATTMSAQQQYGHGHGHGHGSMSMATGYSIDSNCSTMDTGDSSPSPSQSPYILPPVAAERPSSFYTIYTDLRRIARGEQTPDGSGRRGRSFRVLSSIICIAIRLKGRMASRTKPQKSADKEIREPRCQLREQCTKMKKRKRGGESTASSTALKYSGVSERKGKWNAEVRVSLVCGTKVWVGTFGSQKEAALAADAARYHCTAKSKEYSFPDFIQHLGPSQYHKVQALCNSGQDHDVKELVKSLAKAHAAKFGSL